MSSTATAEAPPIAAEPTAQRDSSLLVVRPGIMEFREAWALQERIAALRMQGNIPDTLLLLEHPHTITVGRRGNEENILLSAGSLARKGIAVVPVDRGGDVTYHGPGQLVGYLILQLPSGQGRYVRYIRDLEAALLNAVRDLEIEADRKESFSGIWVGEDKLCAIGVKIDAARITRHGFALNVEPDMSYFEHIIPCGLVGKGVTSLKAHVGKTPSRRRVESAIVRRLSERFDLQPQTTGPRRFQALLGQCTLKA